MDERTAFMELSALLTGVYRIVNDPEDKQLNQSTADEYLRRLKGEFPALQKLLLAYQRLSPIVPNPAIDDVLLGKLKAWFLRTRTCLVDHQSTPNRLFRSALWLLDKETLTPCLSRTGE